MRFPYASLRAASVLAGVLSGVLSGILIGCQPFPGLDSDPALTAVSSGSGQPLPASPDCASCHAYPLHDINHYYHLVSSDTMRYRSGKPVPNYVATCLDCHFNSIKHFPFTRQDTVWADSQGRELPMHGSPSDVVLRTREVPEYRPIPASGPADTARGRLLAAEIDSLIQRYARAGKPVPWRTGFLHLNGSVDVTFPPDLVSFPESLATAYRPRDFSCSAIACHKKPAAVYRWKSSRGFGNCPSFDGMDPTCSEIPDPAAAQPETP
jgi:hypothetical protein